MNPEILEKLLDYIDAQVEFAIACVDLNRARGTVPDLTDSYIVAGNAERRVEHARNHVRELNHLLQGDGK